MTANTQGAFFRKAKSAMLQGTIKWSSGGGQTFQAEVIDLSGLTGAEQITGVVNNGSGECRCTIASHSFETGDHVHVTGVTGATGANGTWVVTDSGTNTIDLDNSVFGGAYSPSDEDWAILLDDLEFHNEIDAGALADTNGNVNLLTNANMTNTLGVMNCEDVTFSALNHSAEVQALIISRADGAGTADEAICILTGGTGWPFTPNGGDLTVVWASTGLAQL